MWCCRCQIGDVGVCAIADSLSGNLRALDLKENDFGDGGCVSLAQGER